MRAPRPGSRWSRRRVARRARYADYIHSPAWWRTRVEWYATHTTGASRGQSHCAGCDAPWLRDRDDLHHTTYDRLGQERFNDLIPMCRACHTRLHELWDTSPAWRKLVRAQATVGILAALRREHHDAMNA
jgi:hypothetical protein